MKKRRVMALVLAATLAMTGAGEAASVMAADFTDVEMFTEEVQEPVAEAEISETEAPEEIVLEETEPETVDEVMEEEQHVLGEADEAELFEDAAGEEDLFSAGTPEEEFADGAEETIAASNKATAQYWGKFLSQEEFDHWKNTGEEPSDREWEGGEEESSFTDFLNGLSQKTGYVLVRAEDGSQDGYADMVIPEGLTVVVGNGSDINIKSITPNGNIYIGENVNTPGTLEIKEGKGSVTVRDCSIDGAIVGKGSNDTLIFDVGPDGGWNHIGGLQGVENVIFSETRNNLDIDKGTVEFYNITNLCKEGEEDRNIYLNIEGYNKNNVPVFHKNFDLGKCHGTNDQGEYEEWDAGIGINYIETFGVPEGEELKCIDIGEGNPVVKFAVDDAEAINMVNKIWLGGVDPGYGTDIDGTTINREKAFYVMRYQDSAQMSAQEAFSKEGRDDVPEESRQYITNTNSMENAYRIIDADQKSGNGKGYYQIEFAPNYKAEGTLTVPASVTGILYSGPGIYHEETDKWEPLPVTISSVNVPAGKTLTLMNIMASSGTLKITGQGTTELLGCRLKQNVTADGKVELMDSVVKSLVCDTLTVSQIYSRIVIGEYLKFNKATLNQAVIYALPGAYLNIGTIDNSALKQEDFTNIFLGVNGSKKAQVYISGKLDMGKISYTDENGQQQEDQFLLRIAVCDVARAAKAGASFTEDCYGKYYEFDWAGEEHYWNNYLVKYTDKEEFLGTISSAAVDWLTSYPLILVFEPADSKSQVYPVLQLRCTAADVFDPADDGIEGNKYRTAYYDWENDKWIKSPKYFQVGGSAKESLVSAAVSSIKNQTYTGKALKPAVTVKLNGKTLKSGTDYTVAYKNNTKVGTATVTITGKGNYTGMLTKTFKIVYAVPAKGKTFTVGNLKYTVTKSAASNGTVSVAAPVKKTNTSISIPATVKINGYTFKVTAIAANAFKSNTKLKKVTIGTNVTSIGKQAFYGCKALTNITINSKVLKSVGANALKGIYAKATIKVPSAKLTAYKKLLKGKGQSSTVKITK